MRFLRCLFSGALLLVAAQAARAQSVEVRYASPLEGPRTGRLFVIFARTAAREPRLQAGSYGGTAPMFAADVSDWRAGQPAAITADTLGYPFASLRDLPAGEYTVQALLNVYTKVTRADGHTLWVHWDQWEGQHWNVSPGNLVSEPVTIRWDPKRATPLRLTLTRALPPVDVPPDTRWVKRIRMKSPSLSAWWGHDTYIGATVLLPKGFEQEPARRYPAVYIQGHFGLGAPFGFTDQPGSETAEQRETTPQAQRPRTRLDVRRELAARRHAALRRHHLAAPDPVLRRLVRGELGEQWSLPGCAPQRTRPRTGEGVPADSGAQCPLSDRRLHRRLGVPGVADPAS